MSTAFPNKRKDTRDFLRENGADGLRNAARRTYPFDFESMIPLATTKPSGELKGGLICYPSSLHPGNSDSCPEVMMPESALELQETSRLSASVPPLDDAQDDDALTAPFPVHCLPGVAGDMAREIARVSTSQNDALAAASVLGTLSASLGAGLEVGTGGERVTCGNLYILAIAESGTGKSEAFKLAALPFEEAESRAVQEFEMNVKPGLLSEMAVATSRAKEFERSAAREEDPIQQKKAMEAFQKASADIAKLQQKIDAEPRWKVADTTKEALSKVMAGQPGYAVASLCSEARGIFSIIKGRYGKEGGDEDFYCSAYSRDPISTTRVGRGHVNLPAPCLSVLWMVQPDAARNAFSEEAFTESGLLPRFLMFDPKAEAQERTEFPAPIPGEIKTGWATLVCSLADSYRMMKGGEPRRVAIAEGAARIMLDYENENIGFRKRDGEFRDMSAYVARWAENAWRLALVLHAAKFGTKAHTVELEAGTARNAVEIVRWFVGGQLAILASGRYEKARTRLSALSTVLNDAGGEISFRDLRRSHSFDEEEVRKLVDKFPKYLRITTRKGDTGRPSEVLTNLPEPMKG